MSVHSVASLFPSHLLLNCSGTAYSSCREGRGGEGRRVKVREEGGEGRRVKVREEGGEGRRGEGGEGRGEGGKGRVKVRKGKCYL